MEPMEIRIVFRQRTEEERRGVISAAWFALATPVGSPGGIEGRGYGADPQEAGRDAVYRLITFELSAQ